MAGTGIFFKSILGCYYPGFVAFFRFSAANNQFVSTDTGAETAWRNRDAGVSVITAVHAALVSSGRDVTGNEAAGLHDGSDICVSGLSAGSFGRLVCRALGSGRHLLEPSDRQRPYRCSVAGFTATVAAGLPQAGNEVIR